MPNTIKFKGCTISVTPIPRMRSLMYQLKGHGKHLWNSWKKPEWPLRQILTERFVVQYVPVILISTLFH